MAARLLLSDSTAFGWLPSPEHHGNGVVQVHNTTAFISCGGSLVKRGSTGPSILDMLSTWLLENSDFLDDNKAVCCRAVPASNSVPQRDYPALEHGRRQWNVPETRKSILEVVPTAYKSKGLHFKPSMASDAMCKVVEEAAADIANSAGDSFPIIVCAGWNARDRDHIDELFALRHLCDAQDWKAFKVAAFQHANTKVEFAAYCKCLLKPPAILYQTNKADHALAADNKKKFAAHLTRHFIGDDGCKADISSLGGQDLLDRYSSYPTPAHKADFWRYICLSNRGGHYLDIKMALLQPLEATLHEVYRQGDATGQGQSIAQACGVQSIAQTPHLVLAIGQKKNHIFQGCILDCSPKHPLLTEAIRHCCKTEQHQLRGNYMLFCMHLWRLMKQDLGGSDPQHGWNWTRTYGPIFLFQEVTLRDDGGHVVRQMVDTSGTTVPMDGHVMTLPAGAPHFACTRAWGWNHGFKTFLEAVLTCTGQEQITAPSSKQSIAASSASSQSIAQASSSQSIAQTAEDESDEVMPAYLELTPEKIEKIQEIAKVQWYADLHPWEVRKFISMGLRDSEDGRGFLVCKFCKNRKRKHINFQGHNEVRLHFESHAGAAQEKASTSAEQTDSQLSQEQRRDAVEAAGVWTDAAPEPSWARSDAETRIIASARPVASRPLDTLLLAALLSPHSDIAAFIERVTQLFAPCLHEDRPKMAKILKDLHDVPELLRSMWQATNQKGTNWDHITNPWFVDWHVLAADWPLTMASTHGYAAVKATIYSTVVVNLLIDGLTQSIDACNLKGEERTRALRSCCVHFNVACSTNEQVCRLLLSQEPERLKFDLNPGDLSRLYLGRGRKKTNTQQRIGIAQGRSARAHMQIDG